MKIKEKIFYWGPFLTPIATPKAIVNSAKALQNYGKSYECSIINFFGEFNKFQKDLENKNINLINFFNNKLINFLPKHGKLQSRLSFILIFVLSFFPLKKIIDKQKPDFLIIHLITSLPLFLLIIFKFETRFILRISGLPKLGILRKLLWKKAFSKIYMVTCPTISTANYIKSLGIVDKGKIKTLYDPIIEINKISLQKQQQLDLPFEKAKYFIAVGRLTRQKNFLMLCKAVKKLILNFPDFILVIAGDGEDKNKILSYIEKNSLEKNIFLIGYIKNIFPYINASQGFILSSLWEDPGFVLIEAGACKIPVFSSDCLEGPKEIIKDNVNGILFKSNDLNDFVKNFYRFNIIINNKDLKKKLILNNLILSRKFSLFSHYLRLDKILKGFN
ncbi:glycosyltransferase [Candidatus Pelagibacter sp.]|nr:glycosyltransferase [Candidatus Pelagibacter sp.]